MSHAEEPVDLLERDEELATIADSLDRTDAEGGGGTVLIDGPAGIGKTSLLGRLRRGAADRGFRVMSAQGSEIERDFGFGIVRQLFEPLLRSLDAGERARLFTGPAALAAAIFGLAQEGVLDVAPAEASLYGLFWLVAALAERGPMLFAIDDAHWSDPASLRFVQYLGRRLDGLPLLLGLAARPNEPGPQGEILRGLGAEPGATTISPALLSEPGTATIVRGRLGEATSAPVQQACHEATGGNPFLISELLKELEGAGALSPDSIAAVGPDRIAAGVLERARELDPAGPDAARAIAVLGSGADLRAVAALAEIDRERAVAVVDLLVGASVLADENDRGFAHPMLAAAVYESIPTASRAHLHGRAADLLASHGATAEEVAAHLLLCEPGSTAGAAEVLDEAARTATERGAPESSATYLGRALAEDLDDGRRGELLRRLGTAEVALRDPASIGHLQEAAELAGDPERAMNILLELSEVLAIAGQWEGAIATVDLAVARFGGSEFPALLDLEAVRAAYRGYDPAFRAEYYADLPRLLAMVEGREDDDSSRLRWVLAAVGAIRDMPTAEVSRLLGPPEQAWSVVRDGRESSLVFQGVSTLLMIDALDEAEEIAVRLRDEGRRLGSLMAMIGGVGYVAAVDQRRGRLQSSEAELGIALDLLTDNELSLMVLTTCVHACLDTIVERRAFEPVCDLVEGLEVPPPFGETFSGAIVHEVRAAVRMMRGDRPGAVASLREVGAIAGPVGAGPRITSWRSRLALALPEAEREEALALAREELAMAVAVDSTRATAVARRALGKLVGGEAGIELLRESVASAEACPSPLERARSLAELGAALRRGNRRSEARDRLREAAELAQACGAERLEQRIFDELRVAGAKPRRRAISGVDSLTAAELRVAAAAAGGATNREIAQDLLVSLRTVEMHLTNTYRKLGRSSRVELAEVVRVGPEELPPV